MKFKISGTNEIKELMWKIESGVDIIGDVIGNSGAIGETIMYNQEDEVYETDAETYEWWAAYIDNCKMDSDEIAALIGEIEAKYDYDEAESIKREFQAEIEDDGGDCNNHHDIKQRAIANYRKEYLLV